MAMCATCSGELRPEWRFCVFCGSGVTSAGSAPAASARFNPLAIVALVLACVGGVPAIVFGHLALAQIKQNHERGRTIAIVATVLGYVWLAVLFVLLVRFANGL